MKTMFPDSAHGGAVRTGQPAWRRALAIMLIALLSPVPALLAFWADASGDWQPDSWVDPASGHVFTLAELDAFSDDIDGDGLSNAQEMAIGTNPFSPDTDGDGISDLLDPLPLSASNLSPANGIVWGAIALDDADGDGTPNFLDDYPYGQYGGQLGTPDTDGDGIPDFIDPAPEDPYNTSPFNGLQWLGDALADADGDGVPNFHDWYPYDASLWDPLQDPDGDGLVKAKDPRPADPYNPSPVNGLNWGPDVYGDADGDGIPNFYDVYPYDSGNGFVPSEPDADGDGIPDSVDPSPWDYDNFSAANGVSWQGDARGDADGDGISNFYDQFPYDYYNGNVPVSDMDGDGIPDAEDPAPTDPTNLSPVNGGLWYTAALADADGDGNPNFTDPWPYDPTNGNLPPEWNSPTADTDGDGIPNAQDPALADPMNFSIYNGTSWYGAANGDIDGDGIANFRDEHPYDYYNGGYAGPDSDGDGIPDSQDPYPSDPTNGAGGTGGGGDPQPEPDTDGDGRPDSQDPYPNDPYDNADFDHDGIPDVSDPARSDPNNLSPFNGLEWYADVRGDADGDGILNFWDLEPYGPPPVDTDGDGLIDSIDPAPEDFYNLSPHNGAQWPSDALGDFDGDGIPNFFDAWPDDRLNGQPDTDMDGIPDPSDPAPGDPMNYSSYNGRNWYGTEALGDLDNDGRLNFFDRYPEDFYDGNPPVTDPDTDGDGLADSVDPAKYDPDNFSPHNQMSWPGSRALDDDDEDGIKNFDDPEHNPKLPDPDPEPGPGPSCSCYWPAAPAVYASSFVLLNDNFDELTGPWTPESKRDFETVTLKAGGEGAPKTEGLMPLAISLPDGYANGQRSIVIRSSGAGQVRIHAVRGNEEDCVYSNGMGFVLKQGDGWQYWVEGTRAGEVTLEYEFPESGEYREAHRPPGCGSADCITLNYDWSSADFSSTAAGTLTIQVVNVEVKAYRPLEVQEAVTWRLPRERRVIPDGEVIQKKIGIRVNNDGDDAGNENDLIEVEFTVAVPDGMKFVIKRSTNLLNIYEARNATGPILKSGTEVVIPSGGNLSMSYWVECSDALTSTGGNLEFSLRSEEGEDFKLKTLPFRSFTTVVAALSGETLFGSDPLTHGTYAISEALYLAGYNVHYYPEDSERRCIAELANQRNQCRVESAAVFGYSHGGGSVFRVVTSPNLGELRFEFTGYIDAVRNSSSFTASSEERFPIGSRFHFNYYQTTGILSGLPTAAPGANVERDFTATDSHFTIDDNQIVQRDLFTNIANRLRP